MNYKKKIFGLRVLDIFILLVVASGVVLVVKIFRHKEEWRQIRVEVSGQSWWVGYAESPPWWMGDLLKPGLVDKDSGGDKIAEIIEVEDFERGNETSDLYLTIKVRGVFDKSRNQFMFKNRPLEAGSFVEFHFNDVFISGIIIDNDFQKKQKKETCFVVSGKWSEIAPETASVLEKGMVMKNSASGSEIARLLSFRVDDHQIYTVDSFGRVHLKKNPLLKDIYLDLRITTTLYGDQYYFAGHQKVKVGEWLWVYFPEVDLEKIRITNLEFCNE
jgi:hypothetical protein